MPPEAASNFPIRCSRASVKAPRSWPKSSLSISVSGMPAQLTATKGSSRRGPSVVDRAGGELLARAALAADQDRHPGVGDAPDGAEDLLHRFAAAEQIAQALRLLHLRPQADDLALEIAALQQLADLDA